MVSWLKANPGNSILDSCSSMQFQPASRFFSAAARFYAMHSDTVHNKLYAPSLPEHPLHNSLCLLSASPQDMSLFYARIDLIQDCNVNIFQALCPVLCADVIKDLTRMQLAGIDSLKKSWL